MNAQGERGERPALIPRSRAGLTLSLVFVLAVIGVALVGRLYYEGQRTAIIAQKGLELSAIRDLKIDQVVQWKSDLMADGRQAAADPTARDEITSWLALSSDPAGTTLLRGWLDDLILQRQYPTAVLVSADGTRWIASTGGVAPGVRDRAEVAAARSSMEVTMTDLFLDSAGNPGLDVIAPLRIGGGTVRAVLILHRDPDRVLYPLIKRWPTPSPSSETLLVRRDGARVLYLNDLRFRRDAALRLSLPAAGSSLLAAQALSGPPRVVEGVDYRGVAVLGAVGQVPGTDWFIVAKVDQSEAYAAIAQTQRLTLIGIGLFIVLIGLGIGLAWRQRIGALYRQRLETERAARLVSQQYDLLVRYANDVVILADKDLRILDVNDAAAVVYGYSREELLGMTLSDLREPSDRAQARAEEMRIQEQGGRLFQAKHVRKDGRIVDVEISARMIESGGTSLYLSIARDVTERVRAENALQESRALLQSVIDGTSDAVYVKDLTGKYLLFNGGAELITGKTSDEVIGQDDTFLFPEAEADVVMAGDRGVIEAGVPQTYDEQVTGADGEVHYYSSTKGPVFDAAGRAFGLFGIARDITERKRAEKELQERTNDLARSNAELEQFAYVASHDLQEPLRMVASYTQLLQRRYQGRLDSDADEFIAFAVDGATRMQTLINDLLTYSRVGTKGAPFSRVDLDPVLDGVLRNLGPAITDVAGTVTRDPMPTVWCDPTQIGQVFQNLIANALKFHGPEHPCIHVGARRNDAAWEFSVKDNGIGIEPQYFDRIFVIFQRLQSRADYPGTGMGLAICKRIIVRHGGRIWVESQPDHGSTFHFTIRDTGEE